MDRLHVVGLEGPEEPENLVPGVGEGRGNDGMWRCLRYRRIMHEGIRQKFGDQHICVITECGMTQGVWGGEDIGPWAEALTVSTDIPGGVVDTPIPVDDYWNSLLWYNSEIMKDDYVMGACLFVTGAAGLQRWETFEHLGPLMERLEAFQEEVSLDTAAPTTTATPPPSRPVELRPKPATVTPAPPAVNFDAPVAEIASNTFTQAGTPVETDAPVGVDAPTQSAEVMWQVKIERGRGLPLLVGDIGVANERITIFQPSGGDVQVTSGSKPEYGTGGFEIYAYEPGAYIVEFLDQHFEISMSGQFTKVIFTKPD
jgi:hypothetical protein